MSREALTIDSDTKPAVLFSGDYSQWKDRFLDFIERQELGDEMLDSIMNGPANFYTIMPGKPDNDPLIPKKCEVKTTLTDDEKNENACIRFHHCVMEIHGPF